MRQFLAIELPSAARERLARLQQALASRSTGFRWVRQESIHLTLRFLGEVAELRDADARRAWARAAREEGSAFELQVLGLGVFPPRGAPRVLWVGLREIGAGGRLLRLAGALERAARDLGFQAQERAFRAHLTIARASGGASRPPPDVEWTAPEPFEVSEVTLFESRLHPAGARYTALARFPLGAPR